MNKLEYAKANMPNYWNFINTEKEIIDNLCPSDFGLENSDKCDPTINIMPCTKCWNENIKLYKE